ncbi:hypothetical protein ILYODFUR_030887 [Ilyodon furcidens]|uniref:Uncharacterized protein n=1 Tax=Ilyodon furcidens TaxID=33524 RepID=A0ABV0T1Q7_9TELE
MNGFSFSTRDSTTTYKQLARTSFSQNRKRASHVTVGGQKPTHTSTHPVSQPATYTPLKLPHFFFLLPLLNGKAQAVIEVRTALRMLGRSGEGAGRSGCGYPSLYLPETNPKGGSLRSPVFFFFLPFSVPSPLTVFFSLAEKETLVS